MLSMLAYQQNWWVNDPFPLTSNTPTQTWSSIWCFICFTCLDFIMVVIDYTVWPYILVSRRSKYVKPQRWRLNVQLNASTPSLQVFKHLTMCSSIIEFAPPCLIPRPSLRPAPQHLTIVTINPQNLWAIQAKGLAASVAAGGKWLIRCQTKFFENL